MSRAIPCGTDQEPFIQLHRPYVTVKLTKYDDGRYWKLSEHGNSVVIGLRYEVKNIGNVAAKDLSLPDNLWLFDKRNEEVAATLTKPGKLTLPPGECLVMESNLTIPGFADPNGAAKAVKHLTSAETTGVEFQLCVNYANEMEDSQTYRTVVKNRVFQDKVQLIILESFVLSKEALQSEQNSTPIQ